MEQFLFLEKARLKGMGFVWYVLIFLLNYFILQPIGLGWNVLIIFLKMKGLSSGDFHFESEHQIKKDGWFSWFVDRYGVLKVGLALIMNQFSGKLWFSFGCLVF